MPTTTNQRDHDQNYREQRLVGEDEANHPGQHKRANALSTMAAMCGAASSSNVIPTPSAHSMADDFGEYRSQPSANAPSANPGYIRRNFTHSLLTLEVGNPRSEACDVR
ncbi:MAG: hypothetical protein OEN20_02365 [Gammaproteobacteria bacterium]|nr:hypothetical protein [Gammaproteobacteria bacterium]